MQIVSRVSTWYITVASHSCYMSWHRSCHCTPTNGCWIGWWEIDDTRSKISCLPKAIPTASNKFEPPSLDSLGFLSFGKKFHVDFAVISQQRIRQAMLDEARRKIRELPFEARVVSWTMPELQKQWEGWNQEDKNKPMNQTNLKIIRFLGEWGWKSEVSFILGSTLRPGGPKICVTKTAWTNNTAQQLLQESAAIHDQGRLLLKPLSRKLVCVRSRWVNHMPVIFLWPASPGWPPMERPWNSSWKGGLINWRRNNFPVKMTYTEAFRHMNWTPPGGALSAILARQAPGPPAPRPPPAAAARVVQVRYCSLLATRKCFDTILSVGYCMFSILATENSM